MRLLIFLLPIISLTSSPADVVPLDAWLRRQVSVTTLDSTFVQERRLPALKVPISTPGRLTFAKPDKMRWQLGEPAETIAVSDGKILTLMDIPTKTARRIGLESPQALRFSLLSGKAFQSPEKFYATFDLVESRVTAGIHQYTVKPKDRRLRRQVPWIFLDIDLRRNELRALEMELQDGSRLRTVFSNPRYDAKLDSSLFHPDLSGYQVK